MIKSEKKHKELSQIFNKDSNILISEAIRNLRDEQPFEGAVQLLTDLYDRTSDLPLRKTISEFMNDIKDQSVATEVMAEIRKIRKSETKAMLIASCWQSPLSYSDHTSEFVQLFLKGDLPTSIECLTVIEESADDIDRIKKVELTAIIRKWPESDIAAKRKLTGELLTILER
jgi:hypothetical protein